MNRTKIIIGSLALTIVGISTYLIINKQKKKKLYNKLISDLETGVNETGTIEDMGTKGGPFDPTSYKNKPGAKLLTVAYAQTLAKKIHTAIGGTWNVSTEPIIYEIFKSLKAKTQVSFLAEQYKKLYGTDMLKDLKKIDYTLFGINWGTTQWLPKIQAIIKSLPEK